jgi:predicted DsbA family dithiol-disulfide isomerase
MAAALGVEMRLPTVSPQPYTHLAFEGLEFAKDHGGADEYNSGVMRAFFQRSEDIGQVEVLAQVAAAAGLNEAAFREALTRGSYGERVAELLRYAVETMQVRAVPLFVIGNERLSGVQRSETLRATIDRQIKSAEG